MDVVLNRAQARAVDRLAMQRYGIPGMVLMENAGRGVVEVLLGLDPGLATQAVAILCGKGNNAGDGLVIARHLLIRGVQTTVFLLHAASELGGDALANFQILEQTCVPLVDLSQQADPCAVLDREAGLAAWYVDAMLGTGARGEPREPLPRVIQWLNAQAGRCLAVDVPSGLDCETGLPQGTTVRADHTCTFVAPKTGLLAPPAAPYVGQMHVVSIGTPPQLVEEVLADS